VGPGLAPHLFGTVLPQASDASLQAYGARVTEALGGKDWSLMLSRAERHFELHGRVMAFFEPLFRRIGYPTGSMTIEVIVGRYPKQPFLIHQDLMLESFYAPVIGGKRLWLWDPAYWSKKGFDLPPPLAELNEKQRADGTVLELSAGDIAYWPADWWHTAETPEFSCTLGISWKRAEDGQTAMINLALGRLQELVLARLPERNVDRLDAPAESSGPNAHGLPTDFLRIAAAMREASSDIVPELEDWWLAIRSNHGTRTRAQVELGEAVSDDAIVRRSPWAQILWRERDGELLIAARGARWSCPSHPAMIEMLEALRASKTVSIGDVIEKLDDESEDGLDGDTVCELAWSLVQAKVLLLDEPAD
jgi:hypothetical protein